MPKLLIALNIRQQTIEIPAQLSPHKHPKLHANSHVQVCTTHKTDQRNEINLISDLRKVDIQE